MYHLETYIHKQETEVLPRGCTPKAGSPEAAEMQ